MRRTWLLLVIAALAAVALIAAPLARAQDEYDDGEEDVAPVPTPAPAPAPAAPKPAPAAGMDQAMEMANEYYKQVWR